MPSRAEQVRRALERAARIALLALLAIRAYRELRARPEIEADSATSGDLSTALMRWTVRAPSEAVVSLDAPPSNAERAWLAALGRTGTPVKWRAARATSFALATERSVGPDAVVQVSVAAGDTVRVILADAAGPIDTLTARRGGASATLPALWGHGSARVGDWTATSVPAAVRTPRRVLVIGTAGWESKFVVAALEEAGWEVDLTLALRPDARVAQGNAVVPDTARHAAVIVLDSIAAPLAARIAQFVRSGGGAILSADSWRVPAFRLLLAGSAGRTILPRPGTPRQTLATIGVHTITPVSNAIVLARRGEESAVAARRVESGRVVQVGYDESWRWRMTGPDGSVEAHREWWSRLVSAVAYMPFEAELMNADVDEAPLAHLIAALGPQTPASGRRMESSASNALLLALSFILLLGEIASRRLRGAR